LLPKGSLFLLGTGGDPEGLDRKTFKNLEWYASFQSRVSRQCEVYLTSESTPFYYLFKVDEAIKSVIDSYYLTKGKKKNGLIQRNEK
jgi:hypothetical protein